MVMEATPSPQCVGREFVRQYYTLLNQAPAHLHRFYSNQSYFVHGGLGIPDREIIPAVGQKQIHQKIQQLNFRDCHAKISQVDSQATLGEGVVVQVTGELSNAGQPMRRFTQTFVLIAQGPKTYYVHNDIFRYQDLGYPGEEENELEGVESNLGDGGEQCDEERNSEPEEDEQQSQSQQHSAATSVTDQQSHAPLMPTQPQPLQQQQQPLYYVPPPQQPVHAMMQPVINGSVHEETPLINQQQPSQVQPQTHQYINEPTGQEQFNSEQELDATSEQTQQPIDEELQNQTDETQEQTEGESFTGAGREAETEQTSNANSNKPKTFANLFSSNFPSSLPPTSTQSSKISVSPPPMSNVRAFDDRSVVHPANSGPALSTSNNISPGQQQIHRARSNQPSQQQQQQRPPRGGPPPRDGERRGSKTNNYGDEHQLFIGNLPHSAKNEEVRAIFAKFGKVVDFRIYSKPSGGGKGPQGQNNMRVPNYGFITFEEQEAVTKVLNAGSIYFPQEKGQKLNIEEKKMRPRMVMEGGSSRQSLNDGNMGPVGGQQQQQQQRGPAYSSGYSGGAGGAMRSGQHGTRGGGRGGFSRGGESSRGGGGMRQPGGNPNYQNRSR